jgi:hypothetical protein
MEAEESAMNEHKDLFSDLNKNISLTQKLKLIHGVLKSRFEFIDRISVALYDEKSSLMKTFLASSGRDYPLEYYDTPLTKAPSLMEIVRTGRPRVINDLAVLSQGKNEHTKMIQDQGYRASYTMGIYASGALKGFIFFNSYDADAFTEEVLQYLDVFSHLISAIVCQELASRKAILSVLKAAYEITLPEDSERASKMERLSAYARVIAKGLVGNLKYDFNDEDIEQISWLSPMLDFGKLRKNSVPMRVFKENFDSEFTTMIEILDRLAACYQNGQQHDREFQTKSRILAAADLFDTLTVPGPGIHNWKNEDAIALLETMSSSEIDIDCVNALRHSVPQLANLQKSWQK